MNSKPESLSAFVAAGLQSCNRKRLSALSSACDLMRFSGLVFLVALASIGAVSAQEDKKTDDLKPADPDTGESTVEERTLGLLPNPFEKKGVKFAVTYIGEIIGNPSGGQKQSAVYEDRFNFASTSISKSSSGRTARFPCQRLPDRWRRSCRAETS